MALVLLAGSLVMLFFVILAGVTDTAPLNRTYFLQAATGGIGGARDVSQWTYFYICGPDNRDCGGSRAAPPFGFAWDGGAANAPPELIGGFGGGTTSSRFYYLWRFGWVFLLLTLFFETLAFFAGFLACCGRLGAAIAYFVASFALLCFAVAVSLTTCVSIPLAAVCVHRKANGVPAPPLSSPATSSRTWAATPRSAPTPLASSGAPSSPSSSPTSSSSSACAAARTALAAAAAAAADASGAATAAPAAAPTTAAASRTSTRKRAGLSAVAVDRPTAHGPHIFATGLEAVMVQDIGVD